MSTVAIVGGHGKVAMPLATLLVASGHEVHSLFRNEDHAPEVAATGARPVVADVEQLDVPALADLLAGVDAVIWAAGAGGGNPHRTFAVDRDAAIRSMNAASAAGVSRYLMVSYFGASPDHGVPQDNSFYAYAEAKAEADQYLRGTGLDWTIVAPSRLTDDAGTGRVEINGVGGESVESGEVPRADVAATVAALLQAPQAIGRMVEFNTGATPIAEAVDDL
ncbi:SDR family oxidoreductase [Rudaeicoccus suwonensis]|uniref:Putative NADH-flavin reductase n=1 Tax=Rudaeicoccus suwonensis TaxID=657409 RepID=A0A561E3I0_9MICO|nr:SDR family oxidoreductase [Rudaeicoccus suwonensis]TWE10168.1 putative NADH-flavin reductase [Rudaeicoccus suwonensis]